MVDVAAAIGRGEFVDVVVSGGVVRVWETRRACSSAACGVGLEERTRAEGELYALELKEFGEETANRRASERSAGRNLSEMYGHGHAPLWRVLSGLVPGLDWHRLHPNERNGRLTLLIRAVEKVVRYEWRAFEKTERGAGKVGRWEDERTGVGRSALGETRVAHGEGEREEKESNKLTACSTGDDARVRWWDPMRLVCEHFGIAYSMLSRVAREVSGLSASDLTDRVKAEVIRGRMREDVKAWVLEIYRDEKENGATELNEAAPEEIADLMWTRVQVKRGRGRWSRAAWAVRFGYSSYTRFQRACLAEYGVSPVELERGVMEEILNSVEGQKSKVQDQEREEVRNTKDEVRRDESADGAVLERGESGGGDGDLGVQLGRAG